MIELQGKYNTAKIFHDKPEDDAIKQIQHLIDQEFVTGSNIRIMPDNHFGNGCTIGTTMTITDKVVPNLVGVDIACSVRLVKTNVEFNGKLDKLDKCIRGHVPFGRNNHRNPNMEMDWFEQLRCCKQLKRNVVWTAIHSLGTLGGGNHFIEAYEDGYLSVHTGSRNIGFNVAAYYQTLAISRHKESGSEVPNDLAYLTGQDMEDYLHDVNIMQQFALMNREKIVDTILVGMRGRQIDFIDSMHNYIDIENRILRKGATDAGKGKRLIIPMNMRDGLLICEGKGNADWNYSAPHGAGRLYGRRDAKNKFTVSEYKKSMEGIYSTCINAETLDEAPFVYKSMDEIMSYIEPTVTILERLKPIYNFKGGKD